MLLGDGRAAHARDRRDAPLHGGRRGAEQRGQRPHAARDADSPICSSSRPPATAAARSARLCSSITSVLGQPRGFRMEHAYWGAAHGPAADRRPRSRGRRTVVRVVHDDEERLLDATVDRLRRASVVGWSQGRFEWGPRALGNRSILADPRRADMKDIVNTKIKFREPFRPFAPSVLVERSGELLRRRRAGAALPARFMLLRRAVARGRAGSRCRP